MKKLLAILLMTFILADELEVDGDLTVTGTIQNDSLEQVIAELQAQMLVMQNQLDFLSNSLPKVSFVGTGSNIEIDPNLLKRYVLLFTSSSYNPIYALINGSYENGWQSITGPDGTKYTIFDTEAIGDFGEYFNGTENFTLGGYSCNCNNLNYLPNEPNISLLMFTFGE